jgi:hypothetical protein
MDATVWADVPFSYEVIGEHVRDAHRLLAIGSDGRLFDLDLIDGSPVPTELSDDWVVDLVAFRRSRQDTPAIAPPVLVIG